MTSDQIIQLRKLLRRANICKIIPGTVIIEAEVYNQILALLPRPDCQAPELPDATYCQSCGKITDDLDEGFRCPDCQQHTS